MSKKQKKKKKGRGKSKHAGISNLKKDVRAIFHNNPEEAFNYGQIIKVVGARDARSKEMVKDILFSLESKGTIRRNRSGRWVGTYSPIAHEGKVDHVNPRFAYVIIEDHDEDIWVRTDDLNFAIDGDIVEVQVTKMSRNGRRAEGKVKKIIKRNKTEFVGRIEVSDKYAFVVPDNRNIHFDVFVYPEKTKNANHNDKVIVGIRSWHDRQNKSPLGEVREILGPAGEHEAEIHSIMAEFELPFKFPESVEKAANKIPVEIPKSELKYRRDFRDITTITVDPEDAKDFDDALSLKKSENGNWEIGVHIADVSHYVPTKGVLETEALERATSVYLVDRTIPMLPEKLSNGVCSLRPKEDKLTFSAVFEMDSFGNVKDRWFGRTIIHSDRRFTYEEAQSRIEGNGGDFADELFQLNALALELRKQRFREGAINFETVEVKFDLDEDGRPLGVIPKERKDAHKMIEEFMLLANKEVATFIFNRSENGQSKGSSTFVYRTHDDPDPEKLDNFSRFASRFGHRLDMNGNISTGLNKLMNEIEGKPEQNLLESIAIRAMAKAKYTTAPKGHFGLAIDHYTHFTSPIRRYPDVMVHRLLWDYLNGGKSPDNEPYEKKCLHSSEREKRATEAERASIKYKQVEYMTSMLGETFEGLVSGVTEWGIFVEIIETKCEGMIRMTDLEDDFYDFDEKNFRVVGRKSHKVISLGDKVYVQVMKTDIDRRTIDLLPVDQPDEDIDNQKR